jgi:hypothetical protein
MRASQGHHRYRPRGHPEIMSNTTQMQRLFIHHRPTIILTTVADVIEAIWRRNMTRLF